MADTHVLGVYVCIVCPCSAVFGTGHLSGSWSLTAQGYMLDWLGEVTSTVSFCQISGVVCYPTNLCISCRLCMDLCWTYGVCKLCILVSFFYFCPCILSLFHV